MGVEDPMGNPHLDGDSDGEALWVCGDERGSGDGMDMLPVLLPPPTLVALVRLLPSPPPPLPPLLVDLANTFIIFRRGPCSFVELNSKH